MKPTLKIAASLAIATMFGVCHAQEASPLVPMGKAAVVAAQTSSPTNYVLLEPIANRPMKRAQESSGLLEPLPKTAAENVAIKSLDGRRITISPMSFKRGVFDEHEFKVHNHSNQWLRQAKILLTAPVGGVVQQVTPKPDSVDGSSILVTVDGIEPGQHKVVKVAINYPRNKFAKFESIVITENWGGRTYAADKKTEVQTEIETGDKVAVDVSKPASKRMLEPMSSQEASGMLKPKVPAIMASSTTRRTALNVDKPLVTAVEKPTNPVVVDRGSSADQTKVENAGDGTSVKSYFHGPREVIAGEVNDYQIDIQNLSAESSGEIIVQLSIPRNMKLTVLDRDAWYDAKNRKVSWQLKRVEGRVLESIRYKAVVKESGSIEQLVVVGMDSKVQSTSSLKTAAR